MPDLKKVTLQVKLRSVFILGIPAEIRPTWLGCLLRERRPEWSGILPCEAILLYLN